MTSNVKVCYTPFIFQTEWDLTLEETYSGVCQGEHLYPYSVFWKCLPNNNNYRTATSNTLSSTHKIYDKIIVIPSHLTAHKPRRVLKKILKKKWHVTQHFTKRQELIVTIARIGHNSFLTRSLLINENPPLCTCNYTPDFN